MVCSDGQCPFWPWISRFPSMIPVIKKRTSLQKQSILGGLDELLGRVESIYPQKNVTGALGWEKRGFFLRANISEKEHFGQKKNYFWKKDIWSKMLYHMDFLRKFMLSYCKLAQKTGQLRQFEWILTCFLHKHKGTICPPKKNQLKVWHLVQKATSYGLFSKNWVELLQISEKRSIRIGD